MHRPLRRCVEPFILPPISRLVISHREHAHNANQLGMSAIVAALSRTCHRRAWTYLILPRHDFSSLSYSRTGALHGAPFHRVRPTLREPQHRLYHADHDNSTIYALSTASGRAAIAVIRVSGPACKQVGDMRPAMSCCIANG